jgi:tetratricopeptide (TPR) repeat protein
MEAYPGELLVGVFPLVFCVDATTTSTTASTTDGIKNKPPESPSHRSQFDRFLDAVSSMEEGEEHPLAVEESSSRPTKSLFRGDEDEDSDDEDEYLLSSPNSLDNDVILSGKQRNTVPKISLNMGSFRLPGRSSSNSSDNPTAMSAPPPMNTSYAKALQQGQGFFQRARIVSISNRHGFPPSKDSTGEERNRIAQFINPKTLSIDPTKLLHSLNHRPIDGILPSGWLEKHARALPSVLMVVVPVTGNSDTSTSSDKQLLETLESLQMSLASKRECQVHVVGLVQEGVSMIQAEQWNQTLSEELYGQHTHITLLDVADLSSEKAPSQVLQQLHRSIRNASLTYYLHQARRTKSKLAQLGHARHSPILLPLVIRYCFKVAMYYEFQWKHEKSLKFMAEAYRHVEQYYRYLLQKRQEELSDEPVSASSTKPTKPPIKIVAGSTITPSTSGETEQGGVELSLGTPQKADSFDEIVERVPPTSPDMLHQCRAVADWLNFKILQAGFVSHTEGGLLAASSQWQKHAQTFTSIRSFISASSNDIWYDWMYVANQRVVVSQLLERHPAKALGDLGNEFDEVLLRCSPWRTYEAAAEALLQLGLHVRRAMTSNSSGAPGGKIDNPRGCYVGGLVNDGLAPILQEEAKQNHREKALDCVSRAISSFERDMEKDKARDDKDHSRERSWSRCGARMYYLAGGILSGLERHAEAIPYLQKAVNYSKGWNGLELVIRRRLIECYEKHIPTQSEDAASESSQIMASMFLDSCFNAEISNSNLRKALEKFSTLRAGETIKWYRDCLDEADSSLPFSFALTFPSATHATAGDAVKASVLIKSNLDYAVHINSVTLLSLAGHIGIPSGDLLSAKNANEGTDGGIIIQAHTEILISTQLELPKDLNQIAIDETGNGGEKEGVAGKGSFAKSARPRTGGITAAGKF